MKYEHECVSVDIVFQIMIFQKVFNLKDSAIEYALFHVFIALYNCFSTIRFCVKSFTLSIPCPEHHV